MSIPGLKLVPRFGGTAVVVLGFLVFLAWALLPAASELREAVIAMKANTALGFMALGLSLRLSEARGRGENVRLVLAALATLLGLVTLLEYAFGASFAFDELLFDDPSDSEPGRMAILTAAHFVALGAATLLLDRRVPLLGKPAEWLVLAVALSALLGLFGVLYDVPALYSMRPFNTLALHTMLASLTCAVGILCARPEGGVIALIGEQGPLGTLGRRALVTVVVVPATVGWLCLRGQDAGLFASAFGIAMVTLANVALLAALVFWALSALSASQELRRESEEDLAITVQSIGDAFISTDAAGRVTRMNPVAERMTGFSAAEARGKPLEDIFRVVHEVTREAIESPVARVLREGAVVGLAEHALLVARDGSERAIADSSAPIRDAEGRIRGVVLVFHDETTARHAERAMRESEARNAAVMEAALDAIVLVDEHGNIIEFNAAAERTFGYQRSQVMGHGLAELLIPAELRQRHHDGFARFLTSGQGPILGKRIEITAQHADGRVFPVELAVVPTRTDGELFFTGYIRDITERRAAAAALEASEARFRHLSESGILGIVVCDTSGNVFEANRAFLDIVGFAQEDIASGKLRWTELTPAEWRSADEAAVEQLLATGVATPWEKEYVRRDGVRVPVLVGVVALEPPRAIAFVLDLTARKRAEEARSQALAAADRESVGRERAEVALREAEEQLRQSQRMEAIGTLAGGVAHDFNNLLSVILSYVEMLIQDLDAADPMRADLEQVAHAGRRASELTRQLLAFSRRQLLNPKVVDLNEALSDMTKMLERIIGEDIALTILPGKDLGAVYVDPSQIEQVLLNLVINARDAMPSGGKITIETTRVELDPTYAARHLEVVPGSYVVLIVSDTGMGMDRSVQSRIFEPFFTTKEKGKGTGLGLSTVYGIVKQSGGHVWVYSEINKGTTFKVYLPRSESSPVQSERRGAPKQLRGSETVLLAEDDEHVRALAATILRRYGYHVLEAPTGGDALLICEQQAEPIDILLTDVVMPKMSGRELWERLMLLRPTMRVLFMSGYTDDAVVRHGVLSSEFDFVQKPLTPDALLTKLRRVLDRKN